MAKKAIPCRCGKTKKTFKFDVGPFFINECCEEAGYDHHGNLKEESHNNESDNLELNSVVQENNVVENGDLVAGNKIINSTDFPEEKGKYESKTLKELKKIARSKKIKGYSTKNKEQLVKILSEK